ncbi:MAG: GNAT family N-acetyltransferase [Phycisphaerales bacterium]|nr:GNAT family N-acetyltransferase [Phycisphaerales bacterium]
MPTLNIRVATPSDVPLILSLIRALAEYEREPQAVEATEEMLREGLFGRGVGNGGRGASAECVIGEVDGVAKGFAVFFHNYSTWKGRSGMYLEDLFVVPEVRGVGLGKALLVHLAKIAVERGCGRLEWSVLDWNEPAIGFYKSLGAVAMDEWTVYRVSGGALERLAGR